MNKRKINMWLSLIVLFFGILTQVSAAGESSMSLTTLQINKLQELNATPSKQYTSLSDCSAGIAINNQKFPDYFRTKCFSNGNNYGYYLYDSTNRVGVEAAIGGTTSTTSWVSSSSTDSVINGILSNVTIDSDSYAESLRVKISAKSLVLIDKIFENLKAKQKTKTKTAYTAYVDTIIDQLTKLRTKYSTNEKVTDIIDYLKVGIVQIKLDFTDNDDEDSFWAELGGDSQENENSSTTVPATSSSSAITVGDTPKKSCKLVKKQSMFEGDGGYGLEWIDFSYAVSEHIGRFSDGHDGFAVPNGQTVGVLRAQGVEMYGNSFRCNDGVFKKESSADVAYGSAFCNDPGYTIDGFTVNKMLKESGIHDLNGWYQYFKMNVGDTYRQAYAKCTWGVVSIFDKKEYPASWNCERSGVVDNITIPKGSHPSYSHAANDPDDFQDSYFLDGQSYGTLKASSVDGHSYDISVRCEKWTITITNKVAN